MLSHFYLHFPVTAHIMPYHDSKFLALQMCHKVHNLAFSVLPFPLPKALPKLKKISIWQQPTSVWTQILARLSYFLMRISTPTSTQWSLQHMDLSLMENTGYLHFRFYYPMFSSLLLHVIKLLC